MTSGQLVVAMRRRLKFETYPCGRGLVAVTQNDLHVLELDEDDIARDSQPEAKAFLSLF
jgi:hypothetical protein